MNQRSFLVAVLTLVLVLTACKDTASTAPGQSGLDPDNQKMVGVCTAIAEGITTNKGRCQQMGTALEAIMKPQRQLVEAYQKAVVSKESDHPFASAESKCNELLPVKTLNTFWECKSDTKVYNAFKLMNSLKP